MKSIQIGTPGMMILCLAIFSVTCFAAPFFPDKPGTTVCLRGSIKAPDEDHPTALAERVVHILEPITDAGSTLTVHEITVKTGDSTETRTKYLEERADGIYWVAESDTPEKKVQRFKNPVLVLPLPPKPGKTWDTSFKKGRKQVKVTWEVKAVDAPVQVGGKSYKALHIHGEGSFKLFSLKCPIVLDRYYVKEIGLVKEVSHQTVGKKELTTTLERTEESGGSIR